MKVLGVTGGIGSGKSVVAGILKKIWDVAVIDADALARKAVEPGSRGLQAIVEAFGEGVLQKDGALDRGALGSMVFRDEEKRLLLNSIVHPLVEKLFYEALDVEKSKGAQWVVYDCPLLIEEDLIHQVDQVWLVRASEKERIRRIVARNGITQEEAKARIATQMTDEEKECHSHVVVWNDDSLESLEKVVLSLWKNYFKILLSIE